MKICPICDTENKPQATHCEVCGERLTPAAPGELLSPEESVLAQLQAKPAPAPAAPAAPLIAPPILAAPAEPSEAATRPSLPAVTPRPTAPLAAPTPAAASAFFEPDPEPPRLTPAPPVQAAPVQSPPVQAAPVQAAPAPAPAQAAPRPTPASPQPAAPRIMSSGIPDARLVVYQNKQPSYTHPIVNDETLIGRYDPIGGAFPDLDLTEFDGESVISRKHAYIYRQNREYILYPVSNGGTQLNNELVDMGARRKLKDGDVIILAAKLAMKFHIDA